jgi:DNA-binding LacI/PurR family transcriptional regulator
MVEKRVTLKEIARLCELAPTTVSSILHGRKTYCSQAKIDRVHALVKKYGYRPNVGYNIMTGRATNIVAVVFSQKRITQHEMLRNLYMNLCTGLNERNYAMYTAVLSGEDSEQKSLVRSLEERGCRAFLFIGTPKNYSELEKYLLDKGHRVLGFNNRQASDGVCADQVGAYIRYLDFLELGGRQNIRLALTEEYMTDHLLPRLPVERQARYADCGMKVDRVGFVHGNSALHYFRLGYRQAQKEVQRNPGVEAMLFATDYHVLGAAAALSGMGKLANAIELFGMDDAASVCFSGVRMTTTRFDMDAAASLLMERLVHFKPGIRMLEGDIVHYPDSKERIFSHSS